MTIQCSRSLNENKDAIDRIFLYPVMEQECGKYEIFHEGLRKDFLQELNGRHI